MPASATACAVQLFVAYSLPQLLVLWFFLVVTVLVKPAQCACTGSQNNCLCLDATTICTSTLLALGSQHLRQLILCQASIRVRHVVLRLRKLRETIKAELKCCLCALPWSFCIYRIWGSDQQLFCGHHMQTESKNKPICCNQQKLWCQIWSFDTTCSCCRHSLVRSDQDA